jgi:hypothetical protein
MEDEQNSPEKKSRGLSKAFKKLRQKVLSNSSKGGKESDSTELGSPPPYSTTVSPNVVNGTPASTQQTDSPPKHLGTGAEYAEIEASKRARHSTEEMEKAKARDNATRKVLMQQRNGEPPSITHTSSDGSISYFNSASTASPKADKAVTTALRKYTTPGYEWATRSNGYDWDSRREIYGGNVLLGEHYERTMRQRRENVEWTHRKLEAEREQAIKVKPTAVRPTGVKTMITSGYWAGTDAYSD